MITSSGKHISLSTPFSNFDPVEWFRRFEICCRANNWGAEMKAKKFPTLLEGEAIAVRLELMSEEQDTYDTAKKKIIERMVPAHFMSLTDFHKRIFCPRVKAVIRTSAANSQRRYKQTTVTAILKLYITDVLA